jgi:hypothetical protein
VHVLIATVPWSRNLDIHMQLDEGGPIFDAKRVMEAR